MVDEQVEEVSDEFQKLSIHNAPKENIYELQIGKMVTLVKAHLDRKKIDIDERGEDGNTLFQIFLGKKKIKEAKILLSLGCDPTIPNLAGFTPFYTACNLGLTEIVDILIKRNK